MRYMHLFLLLATLVAGCGSSGPKTLLISDKVSPQEAAIVHPSAVPGGLMLVRKVGEKSTYTFSIGYLGSVYVPPGEYDFEVEVSHGFSEKDAGGPAWTAPSDVQVALVTADDPQMVPVAGVILWVRNGVSRPRGVVEAGRTYEIRFGFQRGATGKPVPVTWLSPIGTH